MAHVKNAGGGPGDEDPRRLPHLPTDVKGKAIKKLATKKRKYLDADTARAAAVVEAAERAERGGAVDTGPTGYPTKEREDLV